MMSKKSSIVNKAIQYSLKKKSFQVNKIQSKINKLLRKKKKLMKFPNQNNSKY
jgi:hypothetical protein